MSAYVELYRELIRIHDHPHDGEMAGKWRWRYLSNGRIMADSGGSYSRRIDCLNGCATVLGGEPTFTAPGRDSTGGETYIWRRLNPMLEGGEHIPVRADRAAKAAAKAVRR